MRWDWEAIRAGAWCRSCSPCRSRSPPGGPPTAATTRPSPSGSASAPWSGSSSAPVARRGCSGGHAAQPRLVTAIGTYLAAQAVFIRRPPGPRPRRAMVRRRVQPRRRPRRRAPRWPARPALRSAASCPGSRRVTALLVIDVGTTSVRAAVVDERLQIVTMARRPFPPDAVPRARRVRRRRAGRASCSTPRRGDGRRRAGRRRRHHQPAGEHDRVGPATGEPIAPALGWQDLRTVGECIAPRPSTASPWRRTSRRRRSPGCSTTSRARRPRPVLRHRRHWLAWSLRRRAPRHDHTNAAVTGLLASTAAGGTPRARPARRAGGMLPRSSTRRGVVGEATALPGSPPIAGLVGDQQASLVGQGCVEPGGPRSRSAPAGCSTCAPARTAHIGEARASTARTRSWPGPAAAKLTWGVEAIMLSAGTNIEWLRDDLGLDRHQRREPRRRRLGRQHRRRALRAALLGLGTPHWDFGAAARCSASPGARPAPTSCAPCSKASPIAAPTWSRRPRPTPASRSPRCASTAG